MAEQFDRDVVINIGGIEISSRGEESSRDLLKVTFDITKSLSKDPNTCDIQVYNLSLPNRIATQENRPEASIIAGYVGATSILFSGTLEFGSTSKEGTDYVTSLQALDGTNRTKSKRINKSLRGPVRAGEVLRVAARELGLKPGNLKKAIKRGSVRGELRGYDTGIVLSGRADRVLDSVCKSMGYFYSIQDGQLVLLTKDSFIGSTAALISRETGMVGSPEPGDGGYVDVRSLIRPDLLPGHRVRIESNLVNGLFRVERVHFSGDTRGGDWFADLECSPVGGAR